MAGRIFDAPTLSDYSWILVFPFFAYLYYSQTKQTNHYFGFFLIGFSLVEILKIVFYGNDTMAYYVANYLVIATYTSLIIFLVKDFNIKLLLKEFKLHIIVLLIFNAYIIYVLNQMIMQDAKLAVYSLDFIIEVTYNVLILLVLSLSLIHYLYHETKQGLLLFLASVCIVFSEMVQVAYLFISSAYLLQMVYTALIGVGFYFLYVYIKIKYKSTQKKTEIA
ncbi:hypothetical protein [Olleya sp. UBA1516]|uniref:hypothetical protein n=1 Tax=Olleya sp. UBA1516 TaxID=1947013 RepID=UPI0025E3D89F|nr:hypothetical protein [Olleya sp. UBA1516]|tara:strand:- start:3591 stop:4253 length:663 start_codon:yes stop_codon:yes gene_type:complete